MPTEPTPSEVERMPGATVLEFGAEWCPICQAARPLLERAFREHPSAKHVRIEDGKGKPLGRSFRVKLWPTLVFLRDGQEVTRLVRPTQADELARAFQLLAERPAPDASES